MLTAGKTQQEIAFVWPLMELISMKIVYCITKKLWKEKLSYSEDSVFESK